MCYNPTMRDQAAINAKISASVSRALAGKPSSMKGKKRKRAVTQQECADRSAHMLAYWDKRGRKTDAQKRAGNVVNVQAYRARQRNAILPTSDLKLIKKIYEHCPAGYHVDHIKSLSTGGPHHQDNLQYLPAGENHRKNKENPYDESKAIRWQDNVM